MEPLSIATACVTLVTNITKCSHTITIFVREVRDARGDLDMISRELHSLETVLMLLNDDFAKPSSNTLPSKLVRHLGSILSHCDGVVGEVQISLEKHNTSRIGRGGHWTWGGGKDDMTKFRVSLEAHKSALDLALDMITLTATRDIKKDTADIRANTAAVPEIKRDTTQILEEIARLRARLPSNLLPREPNIILQRFLDESSTYAESVVNDSELSEPIELPASIPERPVIERRESVNPFASFAYFPPERRQESTEATSRKNSNHITSPSISSLPSLGSQTNKRYTAANTEGTSRSSSSLNLSSYTTTSNTSTPRNRSQLSLGSEKEFKTSRLSPTSSQGLSPPSRPSSSQRYRELSGASITAVRPTSVTEFQNHLRRPDDWKWWTLHHRTQTGHSPLSTSEQWTHTYTAITRAPSYLARVDFKLRQRLEPQRETMLLIGIHYPETFQENEFGARLATTLESITDALAVTPNICGTPNFGVQWWTTVVVCIIHDSMPNPEVQDITKRHGLRVQCDTESEHCGLAPDEVPDEDRRIYAHLWEHTTSRTKVIWNRRGMPDFQESNTPLQLIQCQYTSRAGRSKDMGGEEHLLPFIHMLNARSCVSIAAGDKLDQNELFHAYLTTRHKLSTIKVTDPLQRYPGSTFHSPFAYQYGRVPTKIYPHERVAVFKQDGRSLYKKISTMFR